MISHSPEETQLLGARLALHVKPRDVIALTGEMGAGKTTFVQGLAQGLGLPEGRVASPSFVLVREYHGGRLPIYHADLFRLENLSQASTVGIEEFYESEGVTLIEWAHQVPGVLPPEYLEIHFEVPDPKSRRLIVWPHGTGYEQRYKNPFASDG